MGITYEKIKANGNSVVVERQENLVIEQSRHNFLKHRQSLIKKKYPQFSPRGDKKPIKRQETEEEIKRDGKSANSACKAEKSTNETSTETETEVQLNDIIKEAVDTWVLKKKKSEQIRDSVDKACEQLCSLEHSISNEIEKLKKRRRVLRIGITSGLRLQERKNTSMQQNADSNAKWDYPTKTLDEIIEKFSNKHKFACSSPRCRDEEIMASRPCVRSVGSQINSSKSIETDRGALGDHKSLNKLTEKGYKDSKRSCELDEKTATDLKRDSQQKRLSDIKNFLTSPENMDLKGKNDQMINICYHAAGGNGFYNNSVSTPNNYRSKYYNSSSGYDNNGVFNQSCYRENCFSANGYEYNCTHNESYRNYPLISTQRDATTNTSARYTPRVNSFRTCRRICPPSCARQRTDLDTENFCYRTGSSPSRARSSSPSSKRVSNSFNKEENDLCTKYESVIKSKLQKDLREQFQKARERARAKVRGKHQTKDISEANCEEYVFFKKKEWGEYCKKQERERDKRESKCCNESAEALMQKLPQASCSNLNELLEDCINERSAKREQPTSSSPCPKVRSQCELTFTKHKPRTRSLSPTETCSPSCLCPEYFMDDTQCCKIPLPCDKGIEPEYSFETLCMLKKMKITEYRPSKNKNNGKDKQYNDYINKYKKEQEKESLREQPCLSPKRNTLESTPKYTLCESPAYQSPVKSPPDSRRTSTRRSRNCESPQPVSTPSPVPTPAPTPSSAPTPLIRTTPPASSPVPTYVSDPIPTPIPTPIPSPFLTPIRTPIKHFAHGEPSPQRIKKRTTPPVTASSPSLVVSAITSPKQRENFVAPSYHHTNSVDKDTGTKVDQFTERTTAVEDLNTSKIKSKECIKIKECIGQDGTQITQIQRHLSVEEIFSPNIDRDNMESRNSKGTSNTSPSVHDPLAHLKNILAAFQKQCVDVEALQRLGATVIEALSKVDLRKGGDGDKVKIMKTIETQYVESEIYEMNTPNCTSTSRSAAPTEITMDSRQDIEEFPQCSRGDVEDRELNMQTLSAHDENKFVDCCFEQECSEGKTYDDWEAVDHRKKQLAHFPPPPPITCSTYEDEHYRLPSCSTSLAYYEPTPKTSPASQRHTIDCSTYSHRCRSRVTDTSASLSPQDRNIMNLHIGNHGNADMSFNSNYQSFQQKNRFVPRKQSICRRNDCPCTQSHGSLGLQPTSSKHSDSFGTTYGTTSCCCACEKSHLKHDPKSSNSIYKDCTSNCTLQQRPASAANNNCLVIDRQIPITTCSMPQFSNANNDDFLNMTCGRKHAATSQCVTKVDSQDACVNLRSRPLNLLQCKCSVPSHDSSCSHSASEKTSSTPLRGILKFPTPDDCKSRLKSDEDCSLRNSNYFEAEQCIIVTNDGPQKKVQAGVSYKDACVNDRQKILEPADRNAESIPYKDQNGRPTKRVFRTTMSESVVRNPLNFCKDADLHASNTICQSVPSRCSAAKKSHRKSSTCLRSKNLCPHNYTRLDDQVPPFTHCPCMYDAYISMLEIYYKGKGKPVNLYRQS
uniref:Uncharacterized protein n=1 Tax=Glossina pallidipes TaxID=7398 RepID=A0A1A9ZYV4_GLOPL